MSESFISDKKRIIMAQLVMVWIPVQTRGDLCGS